MAENTPAKRGSKSASIEHNYSGKKEEIGKIINDNFRWFGYTIPETDEEFADRLNEFFRVDIYYFKVLNGQIGDIESLLAEI